MRNKVLYIGAVLAVCSIIFNACQNEQQINYARYYVNGKGLYERYCQNCHNQDGTGLKSLYPPLTDTLFLRQQKDRLACIIKYGLSGKLRINGKDYQDNMPANTQLSDIDIAQIIVYITNSFGNKQGFYDVVQANADLKKCN